MSNLKDKIKNLISDKKKLRLLVILLIVLALGGVGFANLDIQSVDQFNAANDVVESDADKQDQSNKTHQQEEQSDKKSDSTNDLKTDNKSDSKTATTAKSSTTASDKQSTTSENQNDSNTNSNCKTNNNTSNNTSITNTPATDDRPTITVNIQIQCSSISGNGKLTEAGHPELEAYAANPTILSTSVSVKQGDSVYDALVKSCAQAGVQLDASYSKSYKTAYVRGINNLKEFSAGPRSGWMYKVNGTSPNFGCSQYKLKGGENILWYYVV